MYKGCENESAASGPLARKVAPGRTVEPPSGGRVRLAATIAAAFLLGMALLLFFQVGSFLKRFETAVPVSRNADPRIEALNQQVAAIQDKFNLLLAESVEMRLKTLEKSVAGGKVSADELRAFEELKHDLKTLENYATVSGIQTFDDAQLEHSRYQRIPEADKAVSTRELLDEVAELKNLFYLSLAGFVGSAFVAAGSYFRQREDTGQLGADPARPHLLTRDPPDATGK